MIIVMRRGGEPWGFVAKLVRDLTLADSFSQNSSSTNASPRNEGI
jgi:hypothetical protein